MSRSRVPVRIGEEDGPFSHVYLSVTAVPGILLSVNEAARLPLWSFPDLNSDAFLTAEWDAYCLDLDRSAALGVLLLTGFQGRSKWGRLSATAHRALTSIFGVEPIFHRNLRRETAVNRKRRQKMHRSPGCYLIYRGEGPMLGPFDFSAAKRLGNLGLAIDAIRAQPYREHHRRAFHAAATALSLALVTSNASPETHFIGDIVYLKGRNDLLIYSKTLEMGAAGLVTSSHLADQATQDARQYLQAMLDEDRMEVAISLFVQSQKKENDNLRSFIAAWSGLELLTNRLSKVVRDDWERQLQVGIPVPWDKDLRNIPPEDYRMRDRFFSIASVLNPSGANTDVQTFVRVNDMRSGFYHRMEVRERDLPTNDVQMLFRKYLRLGRSS